MTATFERCVTQDAVAAGAERPVAGGVPGGAVSPLYRGILERTIPAGFMEAARALSLPFAAVSVAFVGDRSTVTPLPVNGRTEREALALRRTEAGITAEIGRLAEGWAEELRPRAKALVRRIAALELERYAPIALPRMIDKLIDDAAELAAIRFRAAIPATAAIVRLEAFVGRYLKGFEGEVATLLAGAPTELDRAEGALCDLAGAARATGLHRLILGTPAEGVVEALAAAPLGSYYVAAIEDYLRAYGFRHDGADLTAPAWAERPGLAIARVQAMIAGGEDTRDAFQARLTASVKAANTARAVLADEPEAARAQFDALLANARAAKAVLDEVGLLVEQPARAAIRAAFLELGARLTRLGVVCRQDDVFLLTLDEVTAAVTRVQPDAAIGMLRVRLLERAAELERPVPPATIAPAPAKLVAGSVDRAIGRILSLAR